MQIGAAAAPQRHAPASPEGADHHQLRHGHRMPQSDPIIQRGQNRNQRRQTQQPYGHRQQVPTDHHLRPTSGAEEARRRSAAKPPHVHHQRSI